MANLLEPFVFRNGVRARNRVWLAPMTNLQSHEDGTLSDDELHWLELRARGGFGVVETCAAHVALDGQGWKGELGVFDDAQIPGLTRLAAAIAEHGAIGLVQLYHGGLRAPRAVTGHRPWSASAYDDKTPDWEVPRAASEEDLSRVIAQFRDGAVRAQTSGFAGIELHGAHGYLLSQFLSCVHNARTDGWGGDISGRARLVRETLRAVRTSVSDRFVVGVRLSPEDFGNARGLDLDETLTVARWLAEDGADYIHLSLWNTANNTRKYPDKSPIELFREVLPRDVRLVVAGSIWTREQAEGLLARGADGVALGRAAIANPDWPQQAVDPSWQPRRPPLTRAELQARGLSPAFAEYMRNWKGFVSD